MCVLFAVVVFIIVSLSVTYDITYNTIGKLFGISESQWKPSRGGAQFDSVGFQVHVIVFALLIYAGLASNKKNY
jgi:hypothetical protein